MCACVRACVLVCVRACCAALCCVAACARVVLRCAERTRGGGGVQVPVAEFVCVQEGVAGCLSVLRGGMGQGVLRCREGGGWQGWSVLRRGHQLRQVWIVESGRAADPLKPFGQGFKAAPERLWFEAAFQGQEGGGISKLVVVGWEHSRAVGGRP
jgi:hypothetical protein